MTILYVKTTSSISSLQCLQPSLSACFETSRNNFIKISLASLLPKALTGAYNFLFLCCSPCCSHLVENSIYII